MSQGVFSYSLEDIVKRILKEKPNLTREDVFRLIEEKRIEAKNLLNFEGAAFLVATELGVSLTGDTKISRRMRIGNLVSGLNDVTVYGRVLAINPLQKFKRSNGSQGVLRRILIGDETGTVEVYVWNGKVKDLEEQEVKVNSIVKIEHAYSRLSVDGKVELHLGEKGRITLESPDLAEVEIPEYEEFFGKISEMKSGLKDFNFKGVVISISPVKLFKRIVGEGKVQRVKVKDETGEVDVVFWDSKVDEIKDVKIGDKLEIFGSRIKENMFGGLEAHLSKRSRVKVVPSTEKVEEKVLKIEEIQPNLRGLTIEGVIEDSFGVRDVTLKDGSKVKIYEFLLKDETGEIKVSAWRDHAEILSKLPLGLKVKLKNVSSKQGFRGGVELATTSQTTIEVIAKA